MNSSGPAASSAARSSRSITGWFHARERYEARQARDREEEFNRGGAAEPRGRDDREVQTSMPQAPMPAEPVSADLPADPVMADAPVPVAPPMTRAADEAFDQPDEPRRCAYRLTGLLPAPIGSFGYRGRRGPLPRPMRFRQTRITIGRTIIAARAAARDSLAGASTSSGLLPFVPAEAGTQI